MQKKERGLRQKKEEGATSSFDNSKCPQTKGNYMIILNSKKINTKLKKYLKIYINSINYGLLECPHCHSNNLIMWGHYNRNVIFFNDDGISMESCLLSVQCVKCNSCGKTHALLPFGIIPYKQFSDEIISKILYELLTATIDQVSSKYLIDSSIIKNWVFQFKKYYLPMYRL
ncbi:MAG: hypothetical protein IJR82_00150 [Bacilli bacterium]|nr:hypothetical protein [Bacilli bacterium]